ncbi:MAG TPA: sigma-70 family RNA polymerase sigma factor [Acidimicrobiales bacterium]|nr:sigma-70 family RNA polymerase sigma factor [Acidimicrobiales bacterium]
MGEEPTDRELLARAADPQAFALFYRRHVDRLVRFAARRVSDPADAADVAAATFVVALRGAERYDPRRGEPGAWLTGIAARLIANDRRRKIREALALAKLEGRALLHDDDIERLVQLMDNSARARTTSEALCHLPPQAREAVLLVGPEGLSAAEAAAVVGISTVAFRMRLSRARRRLARLVAEATFPPASVGEERSRLYRRSGPDVPSGPIITELSR